jgi:DNA-binding CsgD family transcriptional regulator
LTSEPRSLEAFGSTVDGLYIVDDNQRIVRWNSGAQQLLGYEPSEVLNRPCCDVVVGRYLDGGVMCGPACAVRCSVARGELPQSIDGFARTKDGRQIRLRFSMIVIPSRPRPLVAHVVHRVAEGADIPQGSAAYERTGSSLTPRECQVLRLLARGLSSAQIGVRLAIIACTVRNHVQHILTKSGAHTRAEAVSLAFLSRIL